MGLLDMETVLDGFMFAIEGERKVHVLKRDGGEKGAGKMSMVLNNTNKLEIPPQTRTFVHKEVLTGGDVISITLKDGIRVVSPRFEYKL